MPHRVLILDDDQDFNSLLTDVYHQANYDVRSIISPREALRIFETEVFDLVVTDQRMPELKGSEFVRKIFSLRRDTPVIVISGYLDNDTVRDLIQQGVGGIFVKPLNVFSLLKKTSELIAKSKAGSPLPPGHGQEKGRRESTRPNTRLPFPFAAYPCNSARAVAFAEEVYAAHKFKSNLVMIGAPGADFMAVARDLTDMGGDDRGPSEILRLSNAELIDPGLPGRIAALEEAGAKSLMIVFPEVESMGDEEVAALSRVSKKEGPFSTRDVAVRSVFCLNQELDELYDSGAIDDTLYLFIGTNEVRIPEIREIPEEIVPLAERYLLEETGEALTILPDAAEFLKQQEWPRNETQLRAVVTQAARANPGEPLDAASLKEAYEGRVALPARGDPYQRLLKEFLEETRNEYLAALLELASQDAEEVAAALCIPVTWFEPARESTIPASTSTGGS